MELVWQTHAWEDYLYWQETDKKVLLLHLTTPFTGEVEEQKGGIKSLIGFDSRMGCIETCTLLRHCYYEMAYLSGSLKECD